MPSLFDKIWRSHTVGTRPADERTLIYIDRHVIHDLHAPHAFAKLRKSGRNGMAWDADETHFYLSHSLERRIYKFAYDAAAGQLGARQAFAALDEATLGIPDGAAVDASGHYWCAIHGGGRLHRYAPDGSLADAVEMPVSQPTMCCFAGPELADLYVTSAREKLDAAALKREPRAGGLFRLRPPVPGHHRHWRVGVARAK